MAARNGLPTGEGTAPKPRDVADPHPSTEEHYDREKRPGGARPPKDGIGPNDAIHTGKPPRPPKNVETS